jgi:hypothetical protein
VCLEYLLPASADLLLLEHLPYLEGPGEAAMETERLLHRLQLHFNSSMPATVIFNMHRALPPGTPSFQTDDQCIRNATLCARECPSSFRHLPEPGSLSTAAEMHTHALARWAALLGRMHCAPPGVPLPQQRRPGAPASGGGGEARALRPRLVPPSSHPPPQPLQPP